ncbi:MAG: hypothetical protein CTY16_15805 [Methylobacter sp.]|nr:MAG: hypothetical protein CTY16_15805 [Methylobacter sp.]
MLKNVFDINLNYRTDTMNTTATTFSIAQLQQLSKEGYLGTWRFERWLNVISAVEGFLPRLDGYADLDKAQELSAYFELLDLIYEACDSANIREGLQKAYGCEARVDIALNWWLNTIAGFVIDDGMEETLMEIAIDDSAHSGWGWVESGAYTWLEENCVEEA